MEPESKEISTQQNPVQNNDRIIENNSRTLFARKKLLILSLGIILLAIMLGGYYFGVNGTFIRLKKQENATPTESILTSSPTPSIITPTLKTTIMPSITPTTNTLMCGGYLCKVNQHCGWSKCPTQRSGPPYYPCDPIKVCIDN